MERGGFSRAAVPAGTTQSAGGFEQSSRPSCFSGDVNACKVDGLAMRCLGPQARRVAISSETMGLVAIAGAN
jgi:hypothetical protein